MENLDSNIFFINNDMWWSKEDIPAYDYLKKDNKDMVDKYKPYLRSNDVVVQAGAHCGFVIRELKQYFKRIYTFEPCASMFLAMCMNNPESNIYKFNACLGNEHKLVNMADWEGQGKGASHVQGIGSVPMLMIDDLNLDKCDLIELDLEGYEYYALLGAVKTIEKFKPLLCIECHWSDIRYGITQAKLEEFLKSFGYIYVANSGTDDRLYQYKV